MDNQQLSPDNIIAESSTTISKESTGINNTGKRSVYLRKKNVIYKITNIANNKFYIGSAAQYDKRIGTHVANLRRNHHPNCHLQSAWNIYGENNFTFSILEEVDYKENLMKREQYYIDLYQSYNDNIGYNICKFVEGRRFGIKQPESAKIKIGNFWRGKKHSQTRIQQTRLRNTLLQGKSILVFNSNNNLLYEYPSISETSRQLKQSIGLICRRCKEYEKGKIPKLSKYIFKYKDIV